MEIMEEHDAPGIDVWVGIQQGNLDLLAPRHGPDFFDFYIIIFDIFIGNIGTRNILASFYDFCSSNLYH
jgi:hypothetical protein